jgi:hypothetical protein
MDIPRMNATRLIVTTLLVCFVAGCVRTETPPTLVSTEERAAAERWQTLETEIPKLRVFIQSRAEFLESRRALLPEAERVDLAAAGKSLAEMESTWRSASGGYRSGDILGAVKGGEIALSKARETLKLLGIHPE